MNYRVVSLNLADDRRTTVAVLRGLLAHCRPAVSLKAQTAACIDEQYHPVLMHLMDGSVRRGPRLSVDEGRGYTEVSIAISPSGQSVAARFRNIIENYDGRWVDSHDYVLNQNLEIAYDSKSREDYELVSMNDDGRYFSARETIAYSGNREWLVQSEQAFPRSAVLSIFSVNQPSMVRRLTVRPESLPRAFWGALRSFLSPAIIRPDRVVVSNDGSEIAIGSIILREDSANAYGFSYRQGGVWYALEGNKNVLCSKFDDENRLFGFTRRRELLVAQPSLSGFALYVFDPQSKQRRPASNLKFNLSDVALFEDDVLYLVSDDDSAC